MIAKEGTRQILIATAILAAAAFGLSRLHWAAAILPLVVWLWVISFFRDPPRKRDFAAGQFCAPADGRITEISRLPHHDDIGGPAVRIGIFLSLFNVHVNRAPCDGVIRATRYKPGKFLDARHPDSGSQNESNDIILDVSPPLTGPVVVRQVAGLIARRIICHPGQGDFLAIGQRFGLIKFGSRTELIVPDLPGTDITVTVGQSVYAGITLMLQQPPRS